MGVGSRDPSTANALRFAKALSSLRMAALFGRDYDLGEDLRDDEPGGCAGGGGCGGGCGGVCVL